MDTLAWITPDFPDGVPVRSGALERKEWRIMQTFTRALFSKTEPLTIDWPLGHPYCRFFLLPWLGLLYFNKYARHPSLLTSARVHFGHQLLWLWAKIKKLNPSAATLGSHPITQCAMRLPKKWLLDKRRDVFGDVFKLQGAFHTQSLYSKLHCLPCIKVQ